MKELEIDSLAQPDFTFPNIELKDSEEWMLYFTAAISMKFKPAIQAVESQREKFAISDQLRSDILGAIKSTYWWHYIRLVKL